MNLKKTFFNLLSEKFDITLETFYCAINTLSLSCFCQNSSLSLKIFFFCLLNCESLFLCVCVKDVEANTVRLEEHGQDVLVLEKTLGSARNSADGSSAVHYK